MDAQPSYRRIRLALFLFMMALVLAGITAIPLRRELEILDSLLGAGSNIGNGWPALGEWITRVYRALQEMDASYPFLAYGYDWLAFGHFVIAISFIGPLCDPIRNSWVVDFGLVACGLVIPYAILFGQVRQIPAFWTFVDSLFGMIGFALLWYVRREIGKFAQMEESGVSSS
jgi:hypothetical protein